MTDYDSESDDWGELEAHEVDEGVEAYPGLRAGNCIKMRQLPYKGRRVPKVNKEPPSPSFVLDIAKLEKHESISDDIQNLMKDAQFYHKSH